MEELKYYTSKIEELFIGYECEADFSLGKITMINIRKDEKNSSKELDLSEPIWKPSIIEEIPKNIEEFLNKIRTPYLTKEQIEAEGWKVEWNGGNDGIEYVYYCKGEWKLSFSTGWEGKANEILLIKGIPIYYRGEIKSINELRTICKLLNICLKDLL